MTEPTDGPSSEDAQLTAAIDAALVDAGPEETAFARRAAEQALRRSAETLYGAPE